MPAPAYLPYAAFGAALIVTLVLAAWLTPANWWRQPNARALAIVAGGTWAIGSVLMALVPTLAPGDAMAAVQVHAPTLPGAGHSYRVFDDLNLRHAKGIGARRIAVVPAGTRVSATGLRDGDWWQVRAKVNGREVVGWSSSLWLRRADEVRQ